MIVAEQTVGGVRSPGKAPALPREGTSTALPWGTLGALRSGQQHPPMPTSCLRIFHPQDYGNLLLQGTIEVI